MRVNWFSPLPPASTEIANYTARLLPTLCGAADVVLWTDQNEWDRTLERLAPVRHYDNGRISWVDVNRADVSFYHIGNSPYHHRAIWELSRRQPGVVVLHELSMQHFFAGMYKKAGDRDGFLAVMQRTYGRPGREAAERFWRNELPTDSLAQFFPLTPLAVEGAAGVLVHTEEAFRVMRQEGQSPAAYAPLPYATTPLDAERLAVARRLGEEERYRLVVFGHIGRNRRLDAVFQALARLPDRRRFRLDVFGRIWDPDYVNAQIQVLNLRDQVTLHGFVSDEVLDAALTAAHLVLNLRYPTMGEASATQLRIWNHAAASLVTDIGWYATLPAHAVGHVRPEHEVEDIHIYLRALLEHPDRFLQLGLKGRRLLETKHTPERYVAAVLSLAEQVCRLRSRSIVGGLTARVGTELGAWSDPKGPDATFRRAAEQIRRLAS